MSLAVAASATLHTAVVPCPLGDVRVAISAAGLCAVSLGTTDDAWRADLRRRFPRTTLADGQGTHRAWADAVAALIETPGRDFALPLDIRGTAFQQRVWAVLRTIPAGQTLSYGEVARRLDAPRATRAVAQACGANPLAVVIPCHRVIASDGRLTGYRWGLERKRALLLREGAQPRA
ncbi:methylated-DNA--[protein]-cysteine S-methyltransferase [Tepidimonas sp.]|uniref:methylated-DNA--[protein]-cysteine S-methyltransferase n=1 Tax=Tepidimonas sp. TaxID=2002775 RepID=UPI00391DDB95